MISDTNMSLYYLKIKVHSNHKFSSIWSLKDKWAIERLTFIFKQHNQNLSFVFMLAIHVLLLSISCMCACHVLIRLFCSICLGFFLISKLSRAYVCKLHILSMHTDWIKNTLLFKKQKNILKTVNT